MAPATSVASVLRLVKSILFSLTVEVASVTNALMLSKKSVSEVNFAASVANVLSLVKSSVFPVAAVAASETTVLRLTIRLSSANLLRLVIRFVFPVAPATSADVCKAKLDNPATSPVAAP